MDPMSEKNERLSDNSRKNALSSKSYWDSVHNGRSEGRVITKSLWRSLLDRLPFVSDKKFSRELCSDWRIPGIFD